ncbi:MAG: ABC transporter ATP-binding protein [Pirellulales bacterium]|nr:ABC transporter ATP-binding protein [Pirellulales bacterium]
MPTTLQLPESHTNSSRTSPPAVQCRGLTKEFGKGNARATVLRGVDLDVAYGQMTLLVGPSGCGKTTLISIIAGLLQPTSGRIEVLGRDLTTLRGNALVDFRAARVGFVFQQYNLLPALTAAENAAIPLLIAGKPRSAAVAVATEVLCTLGLQDHLHKKISQLSGGQQQRVAIGRALVHGPELLVCDEPTAALDAASGQTVMELLRQTAVRPDRAVIVVTHDSRVYRFADTIATMSDGVIESVEQS